MASGDTLLILTPQNGTPPASSPAQLDTITGADGTSAENVPCIDFDASTDEYMDFYCVMPEHYGSGGLTLTIVHACLGDTSNAWKCAIAFRSIEDDAEDLDTTDHAYTYNTGDMTPAGTAGEVGYDNITFTDGADSDNVDAGDLFILRVMRDVSEDSMTGDASVLAIHIKET